MSFHSLEVLFIDMLALYFATVKKKNVASMLKNILKSDSPLALTLCVMIPNSSCWKIRNSWRDGGRLELITNPNIIVSCDSTH